MGRTGRIRRAGHDGDARANVVDLRELVVEHRADIFRYARSFCRSDADAEDLAQTAVVRALAAGSEVRDPERAKWYLLRIVRNLATDQARARARVAVEPWADLPDTVSVEPAPDSRLLRDQEHELPARCSPTSRAFTRRSCNCASSKSSTTPPSRHG